MANDKPSFIGMPPNNGSISGSINATLSPRVEHFDGEVPPALSPLDAFAAQSRILAKQLDDSRRGNRRLSRLPPASVERSLSQPRPGYFRSPSSEESQAHKAHFPASPRNWGNSPEVEQPLVRPQSEHPRLSGIDSSKSDRGGWDRFSRDQTPHVYRDSSVPPPLGPQGYFGAPRAESPEQVPAQANSEAQDVDDAERADTVGLGLPMAYGSSTDSVSRLQPTSALAPPNASRARSPRPAHESSDDDYTSSNAGSTFSTRKLSSSSGISAAQSPMSPSVRPQLRSESIGSDTSTTAGLPRPPPFNFSRPMSRSSTALPPQSAGPMTTEFPAETLPSGMNRENRPAPMNLQANPATSAGPATADPSAPSSYIYAKFSLPRGRMVSRDSVVFSGLQTPHFEWQEPLFEATPPTSAHGEKFPRTPSPPPPESFQDGRPCSPDRTRKVSPARSCPDRKTSPTRNLPTRNPSQPNPTSTQVREALQKTAPEKPAPEPEVSTVRMVPKPETPEDDKSTSADSENTLRPDTSRTGATAATAATSTQLTAEDHVTKGIECHENGSLKESTYHLRIAAMQNHPTGMLLYALACRHGWGIRANQREGIEWLRKAADSAVLEVADDEDPSTQSQGDIIDRRTRRAQFALSIYELGVSHLNGWGIEQDKNLALRCFEIAGHWGDVDALAEAGFCYAEGVGCKKDLKKAAKFYRMAESKGMNMVGNSWIYKDKYKSEDGDVLDKPASLNASTTPEKKNRNKSRTRSIFARKKSFVS
ncbi:hypothetical protein FQN54_008287 [Arachnomyces sp. PD_36]|nr:hypothetical protein FQN54_008287 [Arachnomyces sp. PD_36]